MNDFCILPMICFHVLLCGLSCLSFIDRVFILMFFSISLRRFSEKVDLSLFQRERAPHDAATSKSEDVSPCKTTCQPSFEKMKLLGCPDGLVFGCFWSLWVPPPQKKIEKEHPRPPKMPPNHPPPGFVFHRGHLLHDQQVRQSAAGRRFGRWGKVRTEAILRESGGWMGWKTPLV